MMRRPGVRLLLGLLVLGGPVAAQEGATAGAERAEPRASLRQRATEFLERLREQSGAPGFSAALVLPDGSVVPAVAGSADPEAEQAMAPQHRLLSGSIGKTYVTAAAHWMVAQGELELTAPVSDWLDDELLQRLPNGGAFTVAELLRHQTGIPRHVFHPDFLPACLADPDRVWKPEELVAFVFDAAPLFAPGEGFSYADTNYILVGMILEAVSERPFYELVREVLLEPHGLEDTVPSNSRRIPGLAQGIIASPAFPNMPERSLQDGVFFLNPQFEWCGGGYACTASDLARWAWILYRGQAFEGDYLASMLDSVPMGPRSSVEYGLGVMKRRTPLGPALGHDGIMTGYQATTSYVPEVEIAVALMTNTDQAPSMQRPLHHAAVQLLAIAVEEWGER